MRACTCARARARVCVQKERERETERDTQTERQRERERLRDEATVSLLVPWSPNNSRLDSIIMITLKTYSVKVNRTFQHLFWLVPSHKGTTGEAILTEFPNRLNYITTIIYFRHKRLSHTLEVGSGKHSP